MPRRACPSPCTESHTGKTMTIQNFRGWPQFSRMPACRSARVPEHGLAGRPARGHARNPACRNADMRDHEKTILLKYFALRYP